MLSRVILAASALLAPGPALACTLCHSDAADRVRAALFGPDFLTNAAAAFAPAPVLLVAWWLLTSGARRGR